MLRASAMPQPSHEQRARRVPRTSSGAARFALGAFVYLALINAQCTFPEYNYDESRSDGHAGGEAGEASEPAAGGAGAGAGTGEVPDGNAGGASSGGTRSPVGGKSGQNGESGDGGEGPLAEDPQCAPPQWPVQRCTASCQRLFPDHCYDGKKGSGEVDVDCGGSCQACTREACTADADCLSGSCRAGKAGSSCFAPLSLAFTPGDLSSMVGSITWSITLLNDAVSAKNYAFRNLKLRYYFDRSSIVEPFLVRATQATLKAADGQSRAITQKTRWMVERVEHVQDSAYDAYVEVSFDETGQLFPGDQLALNQQMQTGDPGRSPFDQRANYSFTNVPDAPWLHVTVFYQDRLVWGLEPKPSNPQACFARGVNLNGPAVTLGGNAWQGASQASVTTTGSLVSQATTHAPAVTGGTATMLSTVTRLAAGKELSLPVVNDTYLLYLYATSPGSDAEASQLTVQGSAPDGSGAFRSQGTEKGQAWARLGPYRVDVTTGKLTVGVSKGSIDFAGMELLYPQ